MKRLLITGMSGTGKSTVVERLAALGYKAIDLDNEQYSAWVDVDPATDPLTPAPGKDWRWRADQVQALLSTADTSLLIVSGCAENMGSFLPQFDEVILLSAPPEVMVERLTARTNNAFGKQPQELAQILSLKRTIEPLLRASASQEIDTSIGLEAVIDRILKIIIT